MPNQQFEIFICAIDQVQLEQAASQVQHPEVKVYRLSLTMLLAEPHRFQVKMTL